LNLVVERIQQDFDNLSLTDLADFETCKYRMKELLVNLIKNLAGEDLATWVLSFLNEDNDGGGGEENYNLAPDGKMIDKTFVLRSNHFPPGNHLSSRQKGKRREGNPRQRHTRNGKRSHEDSPDETRQRSKRPRGSDRPDRHPQDSQGGSTSNSPIAPQRSEVSAVDFPFAVRIIDTGSRSTTSALQSFWSART
jgi:hypothetical protein